MLFRRLFALLLVLALCFTAGGCMVENEWEDWNYSAEESAKPPATGGESGAATPLLYKVTDTQGHTLWLFGAIHVGREDFYPLPDYVLNAFDGSDTLAVELDIIAFSNDKAGRTEAIRQLKYTDGSVVTDYIPQELYDEAVALLTQAGNYDPALVNYMPVLWSSYVDNAGYAKAQVTGSQGVDRHMLNLAYKQNKEIYDIESGKFQYAMMTTYSPELQQLLLEDSVEKYTSGSVKQEMEDLMALWASGDAEALAQLVDGTSSSADPQEQKLRQEYIDITFTQRNNSMTKYAEYALLSGKEVFVCVGAGHIVGSTGIAQQLANMGYTVQIVKE